MWKKINITKRKLNFNKIILKRVKWYRRHNVISTQLVKISDLWNKISFNTEDIDTCGFQRRETKYGTIILFCTTSCEIFHRTPAGYTADRKTRRKRNMGYYELLSASCHPSPPPSNFPPPPHRASVAPPAATLSGLAEGRPLPPPTPPWGL
jgi:hypothetical protein